MVTGDTGVVIGDDASMSDALDAFGRFVMENLRDKAISTAELTLAGHWKAPSLQKLQSELAGLTAEQQRLVIRVVDSATHDFLFALQEANDDDQSVQVLVHGENVAEQSDGLHGEPYSGEGWQARFSKYGEAPEES